MTYAEYFRNYLIAEDSNRYMALAARANVAHDQFVAQDNRIVPLSADWEGKLYINYGPLTEELINWLNDNAYGELQDAQGSRPGFIAWNYNTCYDEQDNNWPYVRCIKGIDGAHSGAGALAVGVMAKSKNAGEYGALHIDEKSSLKVGLFDEQGSSLATTGQGVTGVKIYDLVDPIYSSTVSRNVFTASNNGNFAIVANGYPLLLKGNATYHSAFLRLMLNADVFAKFQLFLAPTISANGTSITPQKGFMGGSTGSSNTAFSGPTISVDGTLIGEYWVMANSCLQIDIRGLALRNTSQNLLIKAIGTGNVNTALTWMEVS